MGSLKGFCRSEQGYTEKIWAEVKFHNIKMVACFKTQNIFIFTHFSIVQMTCEEIVHFFIKAWNLVHLYSLGPWTFSEMEPLQQCLVAAVAAISLSAITVLCFLHHIFWTTHDNIEKVMSVFWWSRITMIPHDMVNCFGELCHGNFPCWTWELLSLRGITHSVWWIIFFNTYMHGEKISVQCSLLTVRLSES